MRKMAMTLGLAALVLLVVQARSDDKDKPVKDKDARDGALKLEGDYTIVAGEKDGKAEPEERIKGTMVHITADKISVTDKDKKETYVTAYVVDTSRKPYAITLTETVPNRGVVAKGLVEREDDTVRLIYALPDGNVPTEFKTKGKQLMFVMKSAKK